MQDLFSAKEAALSPLADRMRPRTLDEFIGQGHIVGPGRLLRRAIEADPHDFLHLLRPAGVPAKRRSPPSSPIRRIPLLCSLTP